MNENNLLCRSRLSPRHPPVRWLSRLYSNKAGWVASWLILIPSFLYFLRKMRIKERGKRMTTKKRSGERQRIERMEGKSFRLVLSLSLSLSFSSISITSAQRRSKKNRWIDGEREKALFLCISPLSRCYSERQRSAAWSHRQATNAPVVTKRYVGHSFAMASSIAAIDPTKKVNSVVSLNAVAIDWRVLCLTPWRSNRTLYPQSLFLSAGRWYTLWSRM